MLQRFESDLFREPRRGLERSAGIGLGVLQVVSGSLIVVLYSFGVTPNAIRPFYVPFEVLLGLMLVLQGSAELLPVERRMLAGWLRLGYIVLALLATLTAVLRFLG